MVVYVSQSQYPNSSHPLPLLVPLCSLHVCLYFCFANKFICSIFLDSNINNIIWHFSLSDLLYCVWQSLDPSMSLHMALFCSFLWLGNILWLYCCSVTQSCPIFAIPWTTAHQASLSFTISQSLRKLMSIESVMPSNHLVLCHSLLLLPSVFPSIKVFSNDSTLPSNQVGKVLELQLQHQSFQWLFPIDFL